MNLLTQRYVLEVIQVSRNRITAAAHRGRPSDDPGNLAKVTGRPPSRDWRPATGRRALAHGRIRDLSTLACSRWSISGASATWNSRIDASTAQDMLSIDGPLCPPRAHLQAHPGALQLDRGIL